MTTPPNPPPSLPIPLPALFLSMALITSDPLYIFLFILEQSHLFFYPYPEALKQNMSSKRAGPLLCSQLYLQH